MVKYLSLYIAKEKDHNIINKVNIKNAVQAYKKKHPDVSTPVVLFDFIGTIPMLFRSYREVMCAGRHTECNRRAEEVLKKFQDLGIGMVFFLDGPLKPVKFPEWIRRRNSEYENQKKLFANLKANEPIKYIFQKYLKTYFENYLLIAKKYGRVFISFDNECDLDLAEFAMRTKPMAVFGSDSDFMIMPGDFPMWLPGTLNVKYMTVDAINKKKLRQSLGLEQWQMPILATLSGNDWIEYRHVQHIRESCGNPVIDIVESEKSLARFIRENIKKQKDLNVSLADLIYKGGSRELSYEEVVRLVDVCLKFYDYASHKITRVEPDWLRDHVSKTASDHVYRILKNHILTVQQPYIDVSKDDVCSYADLVIPILRRQFGILCCNRREQFKDIKLKVCTKPNEKEPFCIQELTPMYPDFEVQEIDDILSNDEDIVSVLERVKLFAWVVSPKRKKLTSETVLKLLKTIFIIPSVVVNYLLQERQITTDEADVLILTISEASKMDEIKARSMEPPETITERPFWLSHVYTNLIRHFMQAMIFCGLYDFLPASYFDGYLFHKMYAKFLTMSYDQKLEIRKPIADYRIYGV